MIAHMRKEDFNIQTVQEHLEAVSSLARKYGEKVGFPAMAELAGFLHDMGKNTTAFSTYITDAVKQTGKPLERIDHSTAGAKYLYETYYKEPVVSLKDMFTNITIEIVGMVILSHHSGLQNFVQVDGSQSDFMRRVCREDLPYYNEVKNEFLRIEGNAKKVDSLVKQSISEFELFAPRIGKLLETYQANEVTASLYCNVAMKFVFSCLIDADRTDARRFDEGDTTPLHRSNKEFFMQSYQYVMEQVEEWAKGDAQKPINRLRAEMSERCDEVAKEPSSIYQLSIPTGGGKTYASLRYALKHAYLTGKERIIYVVPYTTILEQNADAVRKVIRNREAVLEHHANVIDDEKHENPYDYYGLPYQKRMQLARDNWDHPIIFTTMVQFLDAFYAKGTRKARRLHNLSNAVIIFDEVQSVPVKHISLFNTAVNFLHYFGGSSIMLCTATQPSLSSTAYPIYMPENTEIVEDLPEVVEAFKRVTIVNKVEKESWSAEQIGSFTLEVLEDYASILIVLNTKKAVLKVYQELKKQQDVRVYHLSTSMCPAHRKSVLRDIRNHLKKSDERIICVSTQLIEAGVDISFQSVIRSLAGVDSIAQAAGRCNRNAENEMGKVFIIKAKDENLSKLNEIKLGQEVTEEDVLRHEQYAADLLSPSAIKTYFNFYLKKVSRKINLEDTDLKVELIDLINESQKYTTAYSGEKKTVMTGMFKELEKRFEVIEAPTTAVLVRYGKGIELIQYFNESIEDYDELNAKLKEAQQYSVNVYQHTLRHLADQGLLTSLYNGSIYALRDGAYTDEYGLALDGEGGLQEQVY